MSPKEPTEPIDPITLDPFVEWYDSLTEEEQDCVQHGIGMLCEFGLTLGHPYSSAIKGSSIAMRELRIKAFGQPFRVFYVFNEERNAVLILGGDKTGDKQFYKRMVPQAEKIYQDYLEGLKQE